jgi:hypothetical protein
MMAAEPQPTAKLDVAYPARCWVPQLEPGHRLPATPIPGRSKPATCTTALSQPARNAGSVERA